jgi:DNA-binding CsgD family transcriptional regulator
MDRSVTTYSVQLKGLLNRGNTHRYAEPVARWTFVGRTDELHRLVAAATGRTGRGLIFSGTAGIGKSRLLRESLAAISPTEFALHPASANIASSGLPFGGLAQVLPADPPIGLSPAGLMRWAAAHLQGAAGGRPIVLAIDDAHLLDPPSAALVHLLVREGATLLGTLRSTEAVPAPIRALWTEDLVEHAELAPLGDEESGDLLTEMLGGPVEAASAQRLARLAAGNALLLRELVLAASGGGEMTRTYGMWRWTGRLTLAPSLADLVDVRIGRLTPGVRDVVELVAFGEPIGLDLVLDASAPIHVEAAEERGLIRVSTERRRRIVRLAHPLYGEVVRRRCPVSRSHRLLATLAELVERTGARRRDDLLRVAVWRLDSGTAQDSAMLFGAAAQAFGRFDIPLAARLAESAVEAGGGYLAAELLAAVLLFADQPEHAIQVLDDARPDGSSADEYGRWMAARAVLGFWGMGRPEAVEELSTAVGVVDDAAAAARVRSFEAQMRLQLHQPDRAEELAVGVLAEPAAGLPARAMAQCVLAYLAAARGDLDGSGRLLAEVDACTDEWRLDSPSLQFALEMARGTRAAIAMDVSGMEAIGAAEFADLSQAGDFRFGSGYASMVRANAAWLRGRTGEALRASEQACAALAAGRIYDGNAHAMRGMVAALRGDQALATASMAVVDQAPGPCLALLYPYREQARAWVIAATGDMPAAVEHLVHLQERLRADGFAGNESVVLYDLVRLGRADLAVHRMAALHERGVGGDLTTLQLRHACAAADGSAAELLAVARELAGRGLNVFAAEAAAVAVSLFRASRDPAALAASTLLADVLSQCELLRTPLLLAVQPVLTSRERQVAELAAVGHRSREIADRLYLSPRTVENHLQRVYTKLGVNGRVELPPALRSLPE